MKPMLFAALLLAAPQPARAADDLHSFVTLETSMGNIVLSLDGEHAPKTVANFIRYVNEHHFDGTVFYRIVPNFVVQGGSYEADGHSRPVHEPIPFEGNNGLKNMRGAVTMARLDDPNSAQSEFFIVLKNNPALDQQPNDTENKTGYAVFGRVIQGMDVVNKIATVPLGGTGPFEGAAPLMPVFIVKASVTPAPDPVLPPATVAALRAAAARR